jgi:hypothetical protein
MSKSSSKQRVEAFKLWLESFKKVTNNTKPVREFNRYHKKSR